MKKIIINFIENLLLKIINIITQLNLINGTSYEFISQAGYVLVFCELLMILKILPYQYKLKFYSLISPFFKLHNNLKLRKVINNDDITDEGYDYIILGAGHA